MTILVVSFWYKVYQNIRIIGLVSYLLIDQDTGHINIVYILRIYPTIFFIEKMPELCTDHGHSEAVSQKPELEDMRPRIQLLMTYDFHIWWNDTVLRNSVWPIGGKNYVFFS